MASNNADKRKKEKRYVIRWFANTCSIYLTSVLLNGMVIYGIVNAAIAALILGIANIFIRPFLVLLSLPLTILTLGLFTFVVNALMLSITAWIMPGFTIIGFWTAIWSAILISIFNLIITTIIDQ